MKAVGFKLNCLKKKSQNQKKKKKNNNYSIVALYNF
jgi:hypothetical protein